MGRLRSVVTKGSQLTGFGQPRMPRTFPPKVIHLARQVLYEMQDMPSSTAAAMKRIGIAADHGGFESREYLVLKLREAAFEVIDFGDTQLSPQDDYPDFVIPLAQAVARRQVDRGVAICGSGVGASIAANKVAGVRACLIHENFSARQGVEDDDMNVICFGGRVIAAFAIQRRRTSSAAHG